MKTVIIDHYLFKLTNDEAEKLEELDDRMKNIGMQPTSQAKSIESEFQDYVDELYLKYKNKIVNIPRIYKTV